VLRHGKMDDLLYKLGVVQRTVETNQFARKLNTAPVRPQKLPLSLSDACFSRISALIEARECQQRNFKGCD